MASLEAQRKALAEQSELIQVELMADGREGKGLVTTFRALVQFMVPLK